MAYQPKECDGDGGYGDGDDVGCGDGDGEGRGVGAYVSSRCSSMALRFVRSLGAGSKSGQLLLLWP